ncbi:MAG TPA: BON domain-containing protein [Opitutaceae bacterium]
MKIHKMLVLSLMAAAPGMLFANTATDRQIEDAAKQSYNYRAVLDGKVSASSSDGVVTLTGTVQERDQRALAEDTVSNLPGVVSVIDQIKVESEPSEHSDAWIAMKIRGELLVHANVSATATKVDVNNGVVLLTGTVDNSAQKDLTEAYAKGIDGVRSITNDLVVKDTAPTVGEKMDDASITSQVKYELLTHRSTSAIKTKVSTADGAVLITGDASSDAEKDLVTKLASTIRGVKTVDNEMVVRNN